MTSRQLFLYSGATPCIIVRLDLEKSVSYPALKLDPTVDSCSWFQLTWTPVEMCTLAVDGGAEVNVPQRSLLVPHVPKVRAIKRM